MRVCLRFVIFFVTNDGAMSCVRLIMGVGFSCRPGLRFFLWLAGLGAARRMLGLGLLHLHSTSLTYQNKNQNKNKARAAGFVVAHFADFARIQKLF